MNRAAPVRPRAGVPHRLRPVLPVMASATAAIVLTCLLALLVRQPELPLVLTHLVVLLLVSGAAYLLDDRAAQVTSAVPRSLLRRRLATVSLGFLVAAAGWGVVVLALGRAFVSVPFAALTWEVTGVFWLAVAASAVLSRREVEPGNLVAPTLGLLFIAALISPALTHVTLLLSSVDDPTHAGWWALTIVASVATLVAASRP